MFFILCHSCYTGAAEAPNNAQLVEGACLTYVTAWTKDVSACKKIFGQYGMKVVMGCAAEMLFAPTPRPSCAVILDTESRRMSENNAALPAGL